MMVRAVMVWLAAGAVWIASFLLAFTAVVHNDHFDRIVHARQVARYGELPFRDFLDPGYFMTEFASAGLQWLLGDRLLGDILLDASFIATGTVIVLLLARRVSGSLPIGCAAAALALLAMPRLYDFDKVLFYPLGVLLCWRYIERPTLARLTLLGVGLVAGALFRYDTGLYIGAAALAAVSVVHWADWRPGVRRLAALGLVVLITALPFLLFVQFTAGLGTAADQIVSYAIREGARTRITSPPRLSLGQLAASTVTVRWAPSVDNDQRRQLAALYHLEEESIHGDAQDRTWSYRLDDASAENVRQLVSDPHVEDTHGIDRARAGMPGPGEWTPDALANRWLGIRFLPSLWTAANAAAFVYYLLFALPLLGVAGLPGAAPHDRRAHAARMVSLAVMCLALDVFILRDPIAARIGGMAGPAAVMAVAVGALAWRSRNVILRAATAAGLLLTVWAVSTLADWQTELRAERMSWTPVRNHFAALATSAGETMPYGPWFGLVTYVRECTAPTDRVYASWFVPELYFYGQRGFAAGVSVTFGGHWSEPRYQQRMVELLAAQPVPIVLVHVPSYGDVQDAYPIFTRYLEEQYTVGGETDFGDSAAGAGAYRVLIHKGRAPISTHASSSMPCFR